MEKEYPFTWYELIVWRGAIMQYRLFFLFFNDEEVHELRQATMEEIKRYKQYA